MLFAEFTLTLMAKYSDERATFRDFLLKLINALNPQLAG